MDISHPSSSVAIAAPERSQEHSPRSFENAELTHRYLQVISQDLPLSEIRNQLAELTRELINARSVTWHDEGSQDGEVSTDSVADSVAEEVQAEHEVGVEDAAEQGNWQSFLIRAQKGRQTLIEAAGDEANSTDVAIPFAGHGTLYCRLVSQTSMLPTFVALLKMAAGYFVLAKTFRQQNDTLMLAGQAQTRLRLIEGLFQPGTEKQAVGQWCDHIAAFSDASLVLLCLSKPGQRHCQLVASSSASELDGHGETARLANRLANEVKLADTKADIKLTRDSTMKPRTALALASQLGVSEVHAIPVIGEGAQRWGAVILVGDTFQPNQITALKQSITQSIPAVLYRLNPHRRSANGKNRQRLRRLAITLLTMAALGGLMAVPVPYQVRCPVQLEPKLRRIVSAPFDGVLTEALVKPGDIVQAGQPIGRIDDEALKLERSRNLTEQVRVQKQHEVHLAKGQVAEAQLAALRLKELSATNRLLNDRLLQATITAPIGGVVISEDLKDVEDSSIELGQPLFEIAPLDSLRAEIEVPDYHSHLIQTDQLTSVWIDDGAGNRIRGRLSRIAPSVDIRGDRSVLLCDMDVTNESNSLRPGMDGDAAIDVGTKTIGWIVFHRLWNRIRVYVGV